MLAVEGLDAQVPEDDQPLKEYVGFIWIGDEPGVRLSVWARSSTEAVALVQAEYGEGHPMSLRNLDDAAKRRLR